MLLQTMLLQRSSNKYWSEMKPSYGDAGGTSRHEAQRLKRRFI